MGSTIGSPTSEGRDKIIAIAAVIAIAAAIAALVISGEHGLNAFSRERGSLLAPSSEADLRTSVADPTTPPAATPATRTPEPRTPGTPAPTPRPPGPGPTPPGEPPLVEGILDKLPPLPPPASVAQHVRSRSMTAHTHPS